MTLWAAFFIVYVFFAASPIEKETVIVPQWLGSTESGYAVGPAGEALEQETKPASQNLIPFNFGGRFGYVSETGNFIINEVKTANIGQSAALFAGFTGQQEVIEIKNTAKETVIKLENKHGYPFFLDDRVFLLSREQNSVSELSLNGDTLWSYDFSSAITCADAAAGLLLTGEINGTITLINGEGRRVWTTEPSGSGIPAIFGCAISKSGARLGVISGIDSQRFLLMERDNASFKISYHEFLGEGFRRPVHIKFINDEKNIAYEREGGLGIYDINARLPGFVRFDGRVMRLDSAGGGGMLFLITQETETDGELPGRAPSGKKLIAIHYPDYIMISAPFRSRDVFLERRGNLIFTGGDRKLASFKIEKL